MTKKTNKKSEAQKSVKNAQKNAQKSVKNAQKSEAQKTVKKTAEERRSEIMKRIAVTERIIFEDETTAVKKNDSAMISCNNAIMLTLVSEDKKTAKRVLEFWAHAKRDDVCIAKKLFDAVCEADAKFEAYRQLINEKAKSSKYVFAVESDDEAIDFINKFIATL